MFTTELIAGTGTNKVSLDLTQDVPISLNFLIADIKSPENRNGSYSKTIKLYGTKTNNKFFEHTHDVNIATVTWNPNIKTPCVIIRDGVVVLDGIIRLLQIEVVLANGINDISYEITIFGDNNTLFTEIGDNKLENLDLSAYNHVYNRVNQFASWSTANGVGYVYPLIDYGFNAFATTSFNVEHFRPAIFVKQYIDSIFSDAGYSYTSSFFTSAFFKSLIIPHNGEKFTMSAANLALYQYYIGDTGASAANTKSLSCSSTLQDWWSGDLLNSVSSSYYMTYNDDTTSPFVDTGNLYIGGITTITQNGTYNLTGKADFEIKFSTVPAGTTSTILAWTSWPFAIKILKSTDGGATYTIDTQINVVSLPATSVPITTSYQTIPYTFSIPNKVYNSGDKLIMQVHPLYSQSGYGIHFLNGVTPIIAGTATMDWRFRSTANLRLNLATSSFVSGQPLTINDAIPKDIKQKDFLKSILLMFNLYVDIDKSNNKNYLIETRDTFFSLGSVKDWSAKLAYDKPFVIKPMAEIDSKRLIYKYKDDTDYFNKKYQDEQAESYGQHTETLVNDFTKNDKKTEVIFSPTPIIDNINNDLIIPKIFSYDGTAVKPVKHNIRILMYNGAVTNAVTWNYVAPSSDALGAATLAMSTYPQAAMVNSPLLPTVSIEFGIPNQVFYNTYSYTTNTLFNKYYSRFINEITDRDSKIVTASFRLTARDIAEFDFRDTFFIRDAYYYVNKIIDYNPIADGLTKVELLKLKNHTAFVSTESLPSVITTNSGNEGIESRMFGEGIDTNVGVANSVLIGDNNSSRSPGTLISGNNNNVGESSDRVTLVSVSDTNVNTGCTNITMSNSSGNIVGDNCINIELSNCYNVVVYDGVSNFTGINLSNTIITTAMSNTVNIGGQVSNMSTTHAIKTADFTVDPSIMVYEIDCTGGNITASFGFAQYDYDYKIFYFKRIDSSANLFYIDEPSGLTTIDGNIFAYNTGLVQWDDLPVFYNGSNFRIL